MEDFYRPSLIDKGGPIAPIAPTTVPGTDFVLKNHMVRLLRQNCQFNGFRDEGANEHLNKYLSITQFMKQNRVCQDNISLNLFPFSLTHEAESWFYHLKTHSIHTWEEMILKFLSKYYPYSRALQLRKDILNFWQLLMESVFKAWEKIQIMFTEIGNLTPSSDSVVESLSPLPTPFGDSDSLLEETDTLLSHSDDSLPDYETFCFDIEEKSSGSTTSHSDHSLSDYEAFCFDVDHIEEKSSGSTTSHFDFSLLEYESFHFDLSIDQLPPADRKLTRLLKENISDTSTKDLKIHELNDFPIFLSDCDSIFSKEFSEINLFVLFPSRNKDKVFDPRIFTINGVHFKRFPILILDDFSSILFVRDFLSLTDPFEIDTFLSFPSRNEDKVFNPGILIIDGVFSFMRKSPHLLIDNFMIDKCHILSEISLKIKSSVSFLPKNKEIRGESS
ncbi:putative reverse transcriptase domain-containing protein [Tanacetum coccineum]